MLYICTVLQIPLTYIKPTLIWKSKYRQLFQRTVADGILTQQNANMGKYMRRSRPVAFYTPHHSRLPIVSPFVMLFHV